MASSTPVQDELRFYWAEVWVHRCHQHLDFALKHLEQAPGQLA